MLTFHHLGVASPDLTAEVDALSSLGYAAVGTPFTDPVLGVRGLFLRGCGPQLEVLEQLPGSTVLDGWLARGVRIYHQALIRYVSGDNRARSHHRETSDVDARQDGAAAPDRGSFGDRHAAHDPIRLKLRPASQGGRARALVVQQA